MMNSSTTRYYRLPSQVNHIAEAMNQIPVKSYLVGGVLRDSILGANNPDIDIAVVGSALSVARKAATIMNGRWFQLDNSRDISRVISSVSGIDIQIDIASAKNGISHDISKRDFTINALALDISDIEFNSGGPQYEISKIIDEHRGIKDLFDSVLRMTTNQVFKDDPLRILRAARIAAQYHLRIDEVTEAQIRKSSPLILKASPERIRDEFMKILSIRKSAQNITRMDDLGILTNVIPELEASRKTSQTPYHHWNVLEHMVQTAGQAENIVNGEEINVGPYPKFIQTFIPSDDLHRDYFDQSFSDGHNRSTFLKLSCLLHDIAKPNTKTIEPDGKTRFLKHDKLGAEMAYVILKRLKFSNAGIELVKSQIENHLRPSQISSLGQEPTAKAIRKYYKDTDGASLDILYLNMADYIATKGPNLTKKEWIDHCSKIGIILENESSYKKAVNQDKLLSGHDIMVGLRLKSGPLIGTLIEEIEEARMEGLVSNKKEALELIRHRIKSGEYIA
jgi:poly(A) polymerase